MKLIDPNTGQTVRASRAGANVLIGRGYLPYHEDEAVPAVDEGPSWPDTHDALDKLAQALGVDWPAPPAGKKKLTVAEKIAALEAAGHAPDSEPEDDSEPENTDEPADE